MQLMRTRAMGLSAMLIQSAPACCIIVAPARILAGFRALSRENHLFLNWPDVCHSPVSRLWLGDLLRNGSAELARQAVLLVERFAHGRDMVRCCAAAAADQLHTGSCKTQRIFCKVIGGSH